MITVRNAQTKDAASILALLHQVLELHAAIRPDIFISGTTKYTEEDVVSLIADPNRRTYVAENDAGQVVGYALCEIQMPTKAPNMVPHTMLYIDDLCVDASARGQHVGTLLFEHVKKEAQKLGCYEITLNVWEGNDSAKAFYEHMGMTTKKTQLEWIVR